MPNTPASQPDTQTTPSASLFSGRIPIAAALGELRLRLLDLTGRNRLVNFKHSPGKSLQFVHSTIDGVYKRLTEQNNRVAITPLPEPGKSDWVTKNGRLGRPEAKEFAAKLGINTSHTLSLGGTTLPVHPTIPVSAADLRTLFFAEELGKYCRKLEREAKLAIEETGANMLYLVTGFLEFPEAPDSEKLYLAPLLCIPVAITRTDDGLYSSFYVNFTGEEIADNLSLREKLKRDFGFNLPEFDSEGDATAEDYLKTVSEAIMLQPNWSVRPMVSLTLLSFTNMLLVRDLDPGKWQRDGHFSSLLDHPLVKQVFEGNSSARETQYAEEYPIDDHPKGDLPLIYDADSSQHSALIDVLEGKNRVIEGPPGTGKSQTITNLIAAALQAGKKILFVAEKLAALEVVKSRLNQAGLSAFVLELHSNKTNKKRVLEELNNRLRLRISAATQLPDLLQRHEEKRKELKAYAEVINASVGGNMDLTLHQVVWRAERHRLQAKESGKAVQEIDYIAAPKMSLVQFAEVRDQLRYLASQFELIGTYGTDHPFWGFFPDGLSPEQDLAIQRQLNDFALRFEEFARNCEETANLMGGSNLNMSAKGAENLLAVLENIAPADPEEMAFDCLPRLFSPNDLMGQSSLSSLNSLKAHIERIETLRDFTARYLLATEPASDEVLDLAEKCLQDAAPFGLGDKNSARLSDLLTNFSTLLVATADALRRLQDVASAAGLPFTNRQKEILVLESVLKIACDAPMEHLRLRHEGLATTFAVTKLREGLQKAQLLSSLERQTFELFYLDAPPADSELSEAVQTLREGDAWYRIFQSRWRKAKHLHKTLSKNKAKKSAAEALQNLELLVNLNSTRKEIREDQNLRAACGQWFDGEKTPFEGLLGIAQWLERAKDSMDSVGIDSTEFGPLNCKRATLETLRSRESDAMQALQSLQKFQKDVRESLSSALPRVLNSLDSSSWDIRLETAQAAVNAATAAINFLQQHVQYGYSIQQAVAALKSSREIPKIEAQFETFTQARGLLADRFQGRLTRLEPVFNAHTYGLLVKRAGLPPKLEAILISESCVENYEYLKEYTEGIDRGWQATVSFSESLSKYGRFEPAMWADPSDISSSTYAKALAKKTQRASESVGGLLAWSQYVVARNRSLTLGLDSFVKGLEQGDIEPDKIEHAFTYRFYATVAKSVFERHPHLRRFSGAQHGAIRKEYAELDKEIIRLRGLQIAHACRSNSSPPNGRNGARVDEKTEMHLLEHLIPQQKPRVPVRQILRRAGRSILELKPCFMMGPQAVAQYLEPGLLHFDIIVMDEASQLRPEQAIGAIARGSQLVVVGDPKQLPPTSFFSRMSAADNDGGDEGLGQLATSDAESILDVCISHFQPVRTLRWHYRSRHESLIAFSNQHFYRGNLIVFPSPHPKGKALGLSYHYVSDAVYENQMNQIEASRVVDAAVDHIINRPDDSLGIVTLNVKQRDLIAELLEARLRNLPQAAEFKEKWEAEGMGLFIKNLENVQGDERDCIFISTTFGKPKGADAVRQNFGPISREGGWRRLNVLFTRARKSVAVFTSMRPEDIKSDNQAPEGTKALHAYLEYARTGVLRMEQETGLPPDSDFEIAVMNVLRGKGYEVTPQLGVAGFRIDIAVKHPDYISGYLAAIECDGASYHSGVSVRDRDRIRQEILESLGWRDRIWRIWSTDWFRNPLAETERMVQFLEDLRQRTVMQNHLTPYSDEESVTGPSSGDFSGSESTTGSLVAETQTTIHSYPQGVSADQLVFDEDEDDLEIDVGDLVTFAPTDSQNESRTVRLTSHQTDVDMGLVAEATPLGAILLGATVGETVVLRVPGKAPQTFLIQSIRKGTASS